jgi:hypothetical protein
MALKEGQLLRARAHTHTHTHTHPISTIFLFFSFISKRDFKIFPAIFSKENVEVNDFVLLLVSNLVTTLYFWVISVLFYLFIFGWTRVWTQGFTLVKQALYHWSHASSSICSGYFGEINYLPQLALNTNLLISASQLSKIISVGHRHLPSILF